MLPIYQVLYYIESRVDRFLNAIIVADQRLLNNRCYQTLINQSTIIEKVKDGIILDQTLSGDAYFAITGKPQYRHANNLASTTALRLEMRQRAQYRSDSLIPSAPFLLPD